MGDKERTLLDTVELVNSGVIDASLSFISAPESVLKCTCNGCGSADAKFDFVPDRIWGTYIGHACHVHDWDYKEGNTEKDRKRADNRMKSNIKKLIARDCESKWYKPKLLMNTRANFYYAMVRWRGKKAFWKGKNSAQT